MNFNPCYFRKTRFNVFQNLNFNHFWHPVYTLHILFHRSHHQVKVLYSKFTIHFTYTKLKTLSCNVKLITLAIIGALAQIHAGGITSSKTLSCQFLKGINSNSKQSFPFGIKCIQIYFSFLIKLFWIINKFTKLNNFFFLNILFIVNLHKYQNKYLTNGIIKRAPFHNICIYMVIVAEYILVLDMSFAMHIYAFSQFNLCFARI